jgi:predicted transposase/invertase (TIGR01784 family)
MQNRAQPHFKERALYYLSNAVVNQGKTGGGWDYHIKAVYGVFFLNFDLPGCEKLRTNVILADSDTGALFSDKLKQIYISLPRFNKTEAECETNFERWIYVLNNMETLERLPFAAYLAVVDKLEKIASIRSLTKDEELQYFHALNTYRTNKSAWDYGIETATKEGEEKGLARGLAEGMEKGLKKGIKKGRAEGMKASAEKIARNLKAIGTATDVIMKVTGLSADEISKL